MSLTQAAAPISPFVGERAWPKILSSYRMPHRGRSLLELGVMVVPFVSLWVLAAVAVHHGFWWGMALTIPAADTGDAARRHPLRALIPAVPMSSWLSVPLQRIVMRHRMPGNLP